MWREKRDGEVGNDRLGLLGGFKTRDIICRKVPATIIGGRLEAERSDRRPEHCESQCETADNSKMFFRASHPHIEWDPHTQCML